MVTHRINRVEFELEVSAVELGRRVSDRVSMLHEQRIVGLLDRVCSEVDDSENIDRIDSLELDLGSIALANFDDELLGKLETALRQALRGRPRLHTRAQQSAGDRPQADAAPDASGSSERPNALHRADHAHELLDGYAWTGSLPWWADASEVGVLARHVRDLLVHAPTRWLELLREHAEDRVGLERLARGCDDELFEVVLERAGAGPSLSDLRALDRLFERIKARGTIARVALLAELGRHGRLEPATVLSTAVRELDVEIIATLAELVEQETGAATAAVRAAIASRVPAQRMREQPGRDRVHATTDAPATSEPADDSIELDVPTALPRSAESLAASPSTATPTAVSTPTAATPTTPQPEHARLHQPARAPAPARPPPEDPQLQHARRRALARLDELYIADAGLVILWPFIERLFTRVELLDPHRRFRDDAAQTTAIALLGYLAAADPNPLEHQLAFAKLLCGRSPEQPCPLQDPLSRELCDECDLLLAAVIDHAPVLDNMPIPRFRASFLQRAGALSVRTGSWLLAVERQPYDLVLERFSWSWAWVKFPWMPEALTVEW